MDIDWPAFQMQSGLYLTTIFLLLSQVCLGFFIFLAVVVAVLDWTLVSFHVGVAVGVSDLCTNPEGKNCRPSLVGFDRGSGIRGSKEIEGTQ